jgi:hypothetical protein
MLTENQRRVIANQSEAAPSFLKRFRHGNSLRIRNVRE